MVRCALCSGTTTEAIKCKKCEKLFYCSEEHRKEHKKPHKRLCRPAWRIDKMQRATGVVDRTQGRKAGKFDYTSNNTQCQAISTGKHPGLNLDKKGPEAPPREDVEETEGDATETKKGKKERIQPKYLNWEEFKEQYADKLDGDGSKQMLEYRKQLDEARPTVLAARSTEKKVQQKEREKEKKKKKKMKEKKKREREKTDDAESDSDDSSSKKKKKKKKHKKKKKSKKKKKKKEKKDASKEKKVSGGRQHLIDAPVQLSSFFNNSESSSDSSD